VKKPSQPLYSTRMSEYYQAADLFVGAYVIFNSHRFILIDADEYAFRCMEGSGGDVSNSYIDRCMYILLDYKSQQKMRLASSKVYLLQMFK